MTIKLAQCHENDKIEMRKYYCSTLIELAAADERVVILDADLMSSSGCKPFMETYPERAFDCGVQEANMAGGAAGLFILLEPFLPDAWQIRFLCHVRMLNKM